MSHFVETQTFWINADVNLISLSVKGLVTCCLNCVYTRRMCPNLDASNKIMETDWKLWSAWWMLGCKDFQMLNSEVKLYDLQFFVNTASYIT